MKKITVLTIALIIGITIGAGYAAYSQQITDM